MRTRDGYRSLRIRQISAAVTAAYLKAQAPFYAPLKTSLSLSRGQGVPTFTRATTATVLAYLPGAIPGDSPVLQTAAIGEARFQNARRISQGVYSTTFADGTPLPDNATTQIGYYAEPAATNLALQSNSVGTSPWAVNGSPGSAGGNASIFGGASATKITRTGSNAGWYQLGTVTATPYTDSVYLKVLSASAGAVLRIGSDIGGNFFAEVNLQTLAVTGYSTSASSVTAVGGGWYRFQATFTPAAGLASLLCYVFSDDSQVLVDGYQRELVSVATSPIYTTSAPVTRNADALSYQATGNVLPGVGMALLSFTPTKLNNYISQEMLNLDASGAQNGRACCSFGEGTVNIFDGATAVSSGSAANGVRSKSASSWGGSKMSQSTNGAIATGAFGGSMTATQIWVGTSQIGSETFNGTISDLYIWQRALSDAQLQMVTK